MAPTILIGKDRVAALGSPGGSRIISTVLLGLMQLMDGKSAADVAAAPRIHHQYLPDKIAHEPGALSEDEIAQLKARGFTLAEERAWSNLSLIVWDIAQKRVEAASDPRWKGVGKGAVGNEVIYR
jgi:gamma-glutamyltranspeptidase/glutathione hydrolase